MTPQPSIQATNEWVPQDRPMVIAGPCSAETEQQTLETARQLAATGKVHVFRAGIWKPRTRPGAYEGAGPEGLAWLTRVREETGLAVATEVANTAHVEAALEAHVDMLWIGARTTVNPFSVQELANALRGTRVPVFVKNPVNPDLELWIGALERLSRANVNHLGAIHRGFSAFQKGAYRNAPMWDIAIEMKTKAPEIPLLCDPSHICGGRDLIPHVAQRAMDLAMDGLMIESHVSPDDAWSDAKQQVTPRALVEILEGLMVREEIVQAGREMDALAKMRDEIDAIDEEIVQRVAARMRIAEAIGRYKRDHNVTILQVNRWEEILRTRGAVGRSMGLDDEFLSELLRLIHHEAIHIQTRVMGGDE